MENPDRWTEVTHLIQKVLAEHAAVSSLPPHERPVGPSLAFAIEARLRRAGMLATKRAESPGSGWVSATADVRELLAIYDDDSREIADSFTLAKKSASFKKAWYAERAKRVAELRAKYAATA